MVDKELYPFIRKMRVVCSIVITVAFGIAAALAAGSTGISWSLLYYGIIPSLAWLATWKVFQRIREGTFGSDLFEPSDLAVARYWTRRHKQRGEG